MEEDDDNPPPNDKPRQREKKGLFAHVREKMGKKIVLSDESKPKKQKDSTDSPSKKDLSDIKNRVGQYVLFFLKIDLRSCRY
jgi:hypothetical protein